MLEVGVAEMGSNKQRDRGSCNEMIIGKIRHKTIQVSKGKAREQWDIGGGSAYKAIFQQVFASLLGQRQAS